MKRSELKQLVRSVIEEEYEGGFDNDGFGVAQMAEAEVDLTVKFVKGLLEIWGTPEKFDLDTAKVITADLTNIVDENF